MYMNETIRFMSVYSVHFTDKNKNNTLAKTCIHLKEISVDD